MTEPSSPPDIKVHDWSDLVYGPKKFLPTSVAKWIHFDVIDANFDPLKRLERSDRERLKLAKKTLDKLKRQRALDDNEEY